MIVCSCASRNTNAGGFLYCPFHGAMQLDFRTGELKPQITVFAKEKPVMIPNVVILRVSE